MEAKLRMQKLLQENDVVDLIISTKDRYGRLVAYIYKQGVNINYDALQNGYGVAYKQYCNKQEIAMETDAKQNKIGLWQYGEYQNPADFRRKVKSNQ